MACLRLLCKRGLSSEYTLFVFVCPCDVYQHAGSVIRQFLADESGGQLVLKGASSILGRSCRSGCAQSLWTGSLSRLTCLRSVCCPGKSNPVRNFTCNGLTSLSVLLLAVETVPSRAFDSMAELTAADSKALLGDQASRGTRLTALFLNAQARWLCLSRTACGRTRTAGSASTWPRCSSGTRRANRGTAPTWSLLKRWSVCAPCSPSILPPGARRMRSCLAPCLACVLVCSWAQALLNVRTMLVEWAVLTVSGLSLTAAVRVRACCSFCGLSGVADLLARYSTHADARCIIASLPLVHALLNRSMFSAPLAIAALLVGWLMPCLACAEVYKASTAAWGEEGEGVTSIPLSPKSEPGARESR